MNPAPQRDNDAEILNVAYTRYEGPRGGRMGTVLSLTRWGALRALGARRGWKAKLLPIALIMVAMGPALVVLGVRALFSEFSDRAPIDILDVLPYADYQSVIGVVILLFAIVLAPDLLCPDRRDGTLSLYFATAVGRGEYLLGRFLGAALPLLAVTLVPMLVLFAGATLFADSPREYLADQWAQLPRIVAAGLLLAIYYAAVALAVASLTTRRAYAIGGYVLVLISSTVIAALAQQARGERTYGELAELSTLPIGVGRQLFSAENSPTPGWAWAAAYLIVVGVCGAILLRRYRPESV